MPGCRVWRFLPRSWVRFKVPLEARVRKKQQMVVKVRLHKVLRVANLTRVDLNSLLYSDKLGKFLTSCENVLTFEGELMI